VGGGAGGGVGGVVGRISTADGDAANRDRLSGADVLVGEAGGVADTEVVAGDTVIGESDYGAGGAVVGFICCHGTNGQRTHCNVCRGAGTGGSQLIVASSQTAEAQAGGGNGLGGADRFGGETGGAAAQADIVAGQRAAQGSGGDDGGSGAV